jgi:DNA-damage-inducible protein J
MANLNIRVDDALKKQVEEVLSEIGMSLSTAAVIFFKQVVRYNGIPFELRADPLTAFNRIQGRMEGEAQKAGFKDERELQEYAKSIRKELWEKDHARNG